MTYWDKGWTNPVGGFYARGLWRIQRITKGWYWHHVLASGIVHPHAGKSGTAATLKAAKQAVDNEEGPIP